MDALTYEVNTGEIVRWTRSETGGVPSTAFVVPRLIRFKSFDGREIPAFVSEPRTEGPFPTLIWVHGGPEGQSRPAFDPIVQYFAGRLGIAVVAPNIRGSDGYGRSYLALDDREKRFDSIRDIGHLLDWIEHQPSLDASRTGIYGASYGGYVVLASLVEYGRRIRAGCDVVGISNLVTFLENTSEYRRDIRRREYGDERDPEMRKLLEDISPFNHSNRIESALFVPHGANDPRVPVAEAEAIVERVRPAGRPVWYMLARSEGHSFRKRSNRDKFYQAMASFFAEHLLGDPTPVVELELEGVPTATPTDDPTEPAEGEAE
jgi:dipeptidyl aminopeptidase/acylaminoacyl peptidase